MPANPEIHSKHIPVIDCLRGIAASMVCLFHLVVTGYVQNPDARSIFSIGKNGVYIFFVISGVVIPLSMIRGAYGYKSWGNFMLKRLIRLEPPYIACILLALVYFQIRTLAPSSAEVDPTPSARDLLLHVGYLVPFFNGHWAIGTFWTLAVEFEYYLALSLLMPLALTGVKVYRYGFYFLFLVAPFLLPNYWFFPVHAPLFLIGILYTLLKTAIIDSRECLVTLLLSITALVLTSPVTHAIAGLATILVINYLPNLTHPILEFLGKISYSLYLLHPITGRALVNALSHRFHAAYQITLLVIAGYILSVIAAYALYRIVEKPAKNLSGKIKYNRTFIPFKKLDI